MYSKNEVISDIVAELVERGFDYKRDGPHGKLFAPNRHFVVAVPLTPSDWRAEKNFRADVRRFLRTHKYDPLAEDAVNERKDAIMFNPVISSVKPPPEVKEESSPPKNLNDVELDYVINLHKSGKTYSEICVILNAQGYQLPRGGPIKGNDLAGWLLRVGGYQPRVAAREERKLRETQDKAVTPPEAPHPEPSLPQKRKHPLLHDVMEVVSSNLSDELKEKFLRHIVTKHSEGEG